MILYDYWRSSSAWRVRIALHMKGLPFERRVVNLSPEVGEQYADAFGALNPLRQLPVFIPDAPHSPDAPGGREGGRALTESMAILAFLDEQFPTPPLLPADPWRRARARQLAEMINAGTQPFQNLAVLRQVEAIGGDAAAWARHFIVRGLAALEAASQETEGTFLVGDTPTLADLYLVPQMYNARRRAVDLAPFPTLVRVDAACAALPAFVAAHPDAQSDARPAV